MDKPKLFRYATLNLEALIALATRLRKRLCNCDPSKPPLAGSLNWVVFVVLVDGVVWAFRSPHSGRRAFLGDEYTSKLLVSEVATLSYIRAQSTIPVPEVSAYSPSRDNKIGVPYILMSQAPGHPLSRYDWLQPPSPSPPKSALGRDTLQPISEDGMKKILSQLGAIVAQLSSLCFPKIGSLIQDCAGNYTVGECLSQSFTWQQRDTLEDLDRGPFATERAYLDSLVSAFVSHAKKLPMSPHAFFAPVPDPAEYDSWASYRAAAARWNDFVALGQKIDHSKNRLAYCVAGQLMHDIIIPDLCSEQSHADGFPLGHPDLHLGNIFVDDALNITCIIDWGSASSVPLTELLASPRMLQRRDFAAQEPLIAAFRDSFGNSAPAKSAGPGVWKRADMMRLFHRLLRMLSLHDYHEFAALYALARRRGEEQSMPDDFSFSETASLFAERTRQSENHQLLVELSEDDSPHDYVRREEQASFGGDPLLRQERIAVARKLTLMSEMNENFVADRRLWRWLEAALKDDAAPLPT